MENLKKAMIIRGGNVIGAVGDKNFSTLHIGCVIPFAGNIDNLPRGYLACDGASYLTVDYPDLYAVIGNTYGGDTENFNVPDYRETVLVGVGQNTTDTIASHDVYELGEFKDDQMQSHTHTLTIPDSYYQYTPTAGGGPGAQSKTTAETSNNSGRKGTTTHGKQKGVTYIIKAFHTNEGVDSGVSDDVIDYVEGEIAEVESKVDKITYSTDANECIPALMKTARYNLINTSANVPNSNYSWVLTAEHIKLSTGQYYRIIQDINGTKSDGGTIKYTRTATSTDDATWTWSDWIALADVEHSLPLVFDSGIINNSSVQVYKLANAGYTASGGTDAYNLNLLLSTRAGEEIELFGGKNDGGWLFFARKHNDYSSKITDIYLDGYDVYVRLATYYNFFKVYHKSGVLRSDFTVTQVTSIPDTATEIPITAPGVMDNLTSTESTWSSSKIASEINPTIDISKVFSNGTLNIATLCTTYGAGRYVAVGQGTTGNGTVTIDIWTLVGGAISYIVNALYSPKTSTMFVGYTYENPTIDFDANYFTHCNHIAKVCTLA